MEFESRSGLLIPDSISSWGKSEKETSIGCLITRPNQGLNLQPRLCAPTGNQTRDPSVHGMMFQPTEPHWPGLEGAFKIHLVYLLCTELYFQSFLHQRIQFLK